jgi:hypothetical protein
MKTFYAMMMMMMMMMMVVGTSHMSDNRQMSVADVGKGPTRYRWMCVKRAAGSVKSPTGVTVWWETLERWQDWQARAHVRQSFWTPGHAKRCATSFADDLVPGSDRSWTD